MRLAPISRASIIGAGAWGTALALALRRAGLEVAIWAHEPEVVAAINDSHVNTLFLPGVPLDPAILATGDPARAVAADVVLLTVPTQFLRGVLARLAPFWPAGLAAVVCTKGIEQASGALPGEVVASLLPAVPVVVLSGPTFASEVAAGLPTAATLAGRDGGLVADIAQAFASPCFRLYSSADPVGAQLGGALKNVIAIAAGVVEGRRLGENARAALIARGLAEIGRVATAKGADSRTLMGLSGLGDLVLTCSSRQSRNYSLGVALGQGRALKDIVAERRSIAEGVATAGPAVRLARELGVDAPILEAIAAVVEGSLDIDAAIQALLRRPLTAELADGNA